MEYISKNEKETENIARKIFAHCSPGEIFALNGDLGSGKTTFVKAFAKAAGIKQSVTSPTFVLMKEYAIPNHKGLTTLVHLDCYRMNSAEDAFSIGLPEYFKRKDTIIFIEWPDKISIILPARTRKINFHFVD